MAAVETQCIASLQPPIAMRLSEIGKIVESEWIKTPVIRPDMNLKLGAFVVMPNHFHAIIMIGENQYNRERGVVSRDGGGTAVGTQSPQNRFGPQSKNLASILRGFKSSDYEINGCPVRIGNTVKPV